jgi:hypothetical protein
MTLPPGRVAVLRLADFQQAGQIPEDATWGTVSLGYTGRSGDLVAVAMSYDKTSRYGSQTPFIEGTSRLFKGSMWHVDGTHNTLITTGNGGTEPTRAQVTLFYNAGQGKYRVEQSLAPGGQIWLNVADLIRNQVPDSDGKTIPPDVMAGSYELRDLDHPVLGLLYEGKLVVDKTYGHASYGCAHCCGYSSARLWQNPFAGPVGIDNPDTYQAYGVCESQWYDMDLFLSPHSSNTSVATLTGQTLHTVAVGSATASGKNTLPFQAPSGGLCSPAPMTGTQPVTVKPTISGPNTLWWFNGLSLGVSGYSSQITLTTSTASSYQWAIASGSDKVQLGGSGQNQSVQVTSIGQSTSANDVSITVTSGGISSDPFYLTVKAPYQLGLDPSQPTPVYSMDSTYIWDTDIYYTIEDNFGVPMQVSLPINESFPGSVVNDYSGTDWRQGLAQCLSLATTFYDHLGGETSGRTPTPVYNPSWTGGKVQHWSQDWRVGTCNIGFGPRVQSDTIQKWTDHALHTNIISPNP